MHCDPKLHIADEFQQNSSSRTLRNLIGNIKHVASNFEIVAMSAKMATQVSKSNQAGTIQNNTFLIKFQLN